MANSELLKVKDIQKVYKNRKKLQVKAVDGVSFSLSRGKCIGLVGESGCGKSTLGRILSGLELPSGGNIFWKGQEIKKIKRKDPARKEIQMVFQNSFDAVNLRAKAKDIIGEPLKNFYHLRGSQLDERIDSLLQHVGIDVSEREKYPSQFSGGQLQRICIARMLASEPELLILDEPLSSLDVSVQAQILNLFSDLKNELNLTYLLISHDLEAVYYLADEIMIMYNGRIVEQITDIEDFEKLCHPYTERLLASSFSYRRKMPHMEESVCDEETENTGCGYYTRCPYRMEKCKEHRPELRELAQGHKIACFLK